MDAVSVGVIQAIDGKRWPGYNEQTDGTVPNRPFGPKVDAQPRRRVHFDPELDFLAQLLKAPDDPFLCFAQVSGSGGDDKPRSVQRKRRRESASERAARNGPPDTKEAEPGLRYRWWTVDELADLPPIETLPGTPLAARELTGLYGKGDTYKTFIALGWACGLAARGYPVVYIAAEGGPGLYARITAWRQHHGVERLPMLRVMPANVNLHDERAVTAWLGDAQEQIEAWVDAEAEAWEAAAAGDERKEGERFGLALVIVDTLARNFVGGSETNPQDMGLFVEGCERIRRGLGCAVLVIHHTNEAGDERGVKALRNASYAMMKTSGATVSSANRTVKLTTDRVKEAARPPAVTVEFVRVEFATPVLGSDSSLVLENELVGEEEFRRAVEDILQVGKADGPGGKSANTVYKRLRENGLGLRKSEALARLKLLAESPDEVVCSKRRGQADLYYLSREPVRVRS